MFLLLAYSFRVPDDVIYAVIRRERETISRYIAEGNLKGIGGERNLKLLRAMAIFMLFSVGEYTGWYYSNNSLKGKQYYFPRMIKTLGQKRGYDCDELAQVLLRIMRDNGYRAYFYIPFAIHMTVIVEIDGRWVNFDPSYIISPVSLLEDEPFFVILGDSVGYASARTYREQMEIDARYVRRTIPILYRKAMKNPPDGYAHFKEYIKRIRERIHR